MQRSNTGHDIEELAYLSLKIQRNHKYISTLLVVFYLNIINDEKDRDRSVVSWLEASARTKIFLKIFQIFFKERLNIAIKL